MRWRCSRRRARRSSNLQVTADAPAWYHPGRSGTLRLGPNVLAHFGELHPRVLARARRQGRRWRLRVFLDAHRRSRKAQGPRRAAALKLSPFQPVERDFAFLVDAGVRGRDAAARGARRRQGADRRVSVFDVYDGKGVERGQEIARHRGAPAADHRTLTDAEIEAVAGKVIANVIKSTGGSLRG